MTQRKLPWVVTTSRVALAVLVVLAACVGAEPSKIGAWTGGSEKRPWQPDRYTPVLNREVSIRTRGGYQIWNEKARWFGCLVPKVACSSWLEYLFKISLPADLVRHLMDGHLYDHASQPTHHLYFRSYHPPEASRESSQRMTSMLNAKDVFKFAVVRHPWDRIVSAYRSKYEGQCGGKAQCLRSLFKVPIAPHIEQVTFHEFVVVLAQSHHAALDSHFRPMHLVCDHGNIPYDFVVDLSSVEHSDYVSNRLGANATFAELQMRRATSTRGDRYYGGRTHRSHPCTAATVALVRHLYAVDAAMFGYSFDAAENSCRTYGMTSPPPEEE